jgi:transporter family-2 protein
MKIAVFIPIFLGMATILQAAINKNISHELGLAHAALLGNFLVFIFSIIFVALVYFCPEWFPGFLHLKAPISSFKWWYLFPAFFGFCIVAGLPFAFYKLGAVQVTVFLIATQLVSSALWDYKMENIPLDPQKILGILLALASMIILNFKR